MVSIADRNFLRELGKRIRQHRQQRGWTQQQFAEKCGLQRTFVGSTERGERNLSVLNLQRFARVLRVPVAALLEDS
jgi:transcriptional regulator with XRE-family HTH domain